MRILVTGMAGFIGFHVSKRLLTSDNEVIGIDNLNTYYDTNLKLGRLRELGFDPNSFGHEIILKSSLNENFVFKSLDIVSMDDLRSVFINFEIDVIIHLAAQAGVRFSISNPQQYIESNIQGFFNVLELSRNFGVKRLLYASSSSVYGLSGEEILSELHGVDRPVSLYAATKKSNELLAYSYSHLFDFETVGLRFFTVYGPWGRPDMAPMLFANSIFSGNEVLIFNQGKLSRDFTYVDDVVESVLRLIDVELLERYRVFNVGNGSPVNLLHFIEQMEAIIGIKATKRFVEMQPGDVLSTYADTKKLYECINFIPKTNLYEGLTEFIKWYKWYHKL